jgi:hypothetical protein
MPFRKKENTIELGRQVALHRPAIAANFCCMPLLGRRDFSLSSISYIFLAPTLLTLSRPPMMRYTDKKNWMKDPSFIRKGLVPK